MKAKILNCKRMTFWQLVFSQSKANGADYTGEALPTACWNWPMDTYFQRRRTLQQSTYSLSFQSEDMDLVAR
jgi:hypothetical protein